MSLQRSEKFAICAGFGFFALLFIIYTVIRFHEGVSDQYFMNLIIRSALLTGIFIFWIYVLFRKVPSFIENRKSCSFITTWILIITAFVFFGPFLFDQNLNYLQFFVIVLSLIILGLISYRYTTPFMNPLSDEERSDPLEREVVIGLPYEGAFDLCQRALQQIVIWSIQSIDKENGKIDAWPWTSHVSIHLERINTGQTRVYIRSVLDGNYTRFPEIEQRRNIHNVETITTYLKNRSLDQRE
jgi:hypothetical protein